MTRHSSPKRTRAIRAHEPADWPVTTRVTATALALVMAVPFPALAQQLPSGGSVAAGTATIEAPKNGTLNINQSSNQAIINWNSFSVGAGGTVNFNQPGSSSATLSRVTGSTSSSIAGTINAPGTVVLVNPNGITITKSGVINTGSFIASTLNIKNEDFLAGKYQFQGNGASKAVVNAGLAPMVINYQPTTPLRSAVANTATTIVAPLQLQTIWRGNVSYFTGA